MKRSPENLSASVHQRLLNRARATERPFNELLQYFAMERFLYRLSRSTYADRFTLKGALMLAAWHVSLARSTRDVDLLGHVANEVDRIAAAMRDVCRQEVEPDGIVFDPESVAGVRIAEEAEYGGVRVRFRGSLGNARISMQVDVGFGDAIVPEPVTVTYPVLLDFSAPRLRGYTRESVIAEKFHTMVVRGLLNSRLRDYFDVWALSRQFDFEGHTLSLAVRETFVRRETSVPMVPPAFSDGFAADRARATQWRAFLRKNRMTNVPPDVRDVVRSVAEFIAPVAEAVRLGSDFAGRWRAAGPWT